MDNLSGNGDWFDEDKTQKAKIIKNKHKAMKKITRKPSTMKKLETQNLKALEALIEDLNNYYEKKPLKKVGDLIISLEDAYKLSKTAFKD